MTQAKYEKFLRPPIKEAIFIIIFKEEIAIEKIIEFSNNQLIKTRYPFSNPSLQTKLEINTGLLKESKFSNLQDGIVLKTDHSNEGYILQLKKDGLYLHKVSNYSSWEDLINEFRIVIEALSDDFKKVIIKELGVRYINHIPISLNQSLEDFFKLLPASIEGIPTNLNKFFLQLGVQKNNLNGLIIESILTVGDNLNFVIDLRVSKPMSCTFSSEDEFWSSLVEIRDFKNQLFFSIITDNIKQQFR